MKSTSLIHVIGALLLISSCFAQGTKMTERDSIVKQSWMVTLGWNVVDDSGDEYRQLLDVDDEWNFVPFPSRLSVGRYFENGIGLEIIGTYNKYKEGKIIDGNVNPTDIEYYAVDLRGSYDLNKILGETGFFDPYIGAGIGYTDANNQGRGTYNATLGFRTWFSDHWGLDLNTSGKWTMNSENSSNHIQHAIGVVYQFNLDKGLSLKGEEKLALLKEIEEEQSRVQDSILKQRNAEEEQNRLAEQLKREQEKALLAENERKKQAAEDAQRTAIRTEIEQVGNVYFALNSSYLSIEDKKRLDKLAMILQSNSTIELGISAHTDSRGTSEYNQWLSKRRVKRTVDYLVSKGISETRLKPVAYGETKLTNECKDHVPCSSSQHQQNRRAEFEILSY